MKNVKKFILFSMLFLIFFSITYFFIGLVGDEIWNYGFAYNISKGLVPYRDFNMVVTPLYSFILGGIIFLFGHHLYLMYILNTFIIILSSYLMYKKIGFNFIFVFLFFFFIHISGYNLLCAFFVILLLSLFDKEFKYKDFIIGFIIGLLILTKQTVGVCVMIPLFFLSKNKIKFIIGMLLPLFIFLIYLIYNGALYYFIDYCFLGMFSFTGSNKYFSLLPFEVSIIVLCIYLYKKKLVGNDIWIVICFQIITAPIFDLYHFMLGFIIFYYYLFSKFRINVVIKSLFVFLVLISFFKMLDFHYLITDRSSFMYGKCFVKNSNFSFINDYYRNKISDYDNVFLFSDLAYMVKLSNSHTLNKFDLINNGNMGYNGYIRYINEIDSICDSSSCLFIIDTRYIEALVDKFELPVTNQTNLAIIKYVYDNYVLVYRDYGLNIYTNI